MLNRKRKIVETIWYGFLAFTGYLMFFCWSKEFVERGFGYLPFVVLVLSNMCVLLFVVGIRNRQ